MARRTLTLLSVLAFGTVGAQYAWADKYEETIQMFRQAGESGTYFDRSYGYAVFPTIGKGGIGIGAAHGSGRVYVQGKYVADTSTTSVSLGLQLGGQAFSEIIFFEDERAFMEFSGGGFAFGADASAVAITAGAQATASTTGGGSAGASGGKNNATTAGAYSRGMAVFTIAKGGLMYEAAIAGQKFSYKPVGEKK